MPRIITLTPNPARDFAVSAKDVAPNKKIRCDSPQTYPGGGGINVARAIHRLGEPVLAIFTTGGASGEAIHHALQQETVPTHPINVSKETRIAFHVHDANNNDEYRFNLPGAPLQPSEVQEFLHCLDEEANTGDIVIGSGSLPPETPVDFWAKAAQITRKNGARFALDTTRGLKPAMEEGLFLLRLNKLECLAMAGKDLSWPKGYIDFAKTIIAKGKVECVVLSHGADGMILVRAQAVTQTDTFQVASHSAVGAGDSFVAGILTGLLRNWSDADALRYGAAAAAATRMSEGTALFNADDVERLFKQ